ncbi:arsenate reductase (glutaredoxin) [Propionivibrio dicarboxylicus]|uniref:Arsenate reductase n=1 Tax=Propionivibrio dicarboxylicus TaxID=83767 RepID=A0A1G8K9A2_9RHOO|nr:arsenate reductase (glutaredoxin) [Propionivibrio dicarboxylicus]SDI39947.1 arsenate reductase [Propionivibrio dicarboxylicus]
MEHPTLVIYHNPRCSKSRSVCDLVAGRALEAEIIDYLKTPPSREELRALLDKLGMKASELVRRGESVYQEHYADKTLDETEWLDALCQHPILIERPIVVCGDQAVVGRPPEKALALIESLL